MDDTIRIIVMALEIVWIMVKQYPNSSILTGILTSTIFILKTKIGRRICKSLLLRVFANTKKKFTVYLTTVISNLTSPIYTEMSMLKQQINALQMQVKEDVDINEGKYKIILEIFRKTEFITDLEYSLMAVTTQIAKDFPFKDLQFTKLIKRFVESFVDVIRMIMVGNFITTKNDIISKFESELEDIMITKNFLLFEFNHENFQKTILKSVDDFISEVENIKEEFNGDRRKKFKKICINYLGIIVKNIYKIYEKEKK